jgi:hypothetical protein
MITTIRRRAGSASGTFWQGIEGLWQIWFAHREQHDGEFGIRPAARQRFTLPLEH